MTTENEFLEMANDCKERIEEKNKQIEFLQRKNKLYKTVIRELISGTNGTITLFDLIVELTRSSRQGFETIILNKIKSYLLDMDIAIQTLGEESDEESEEMDFLTAYTISQLSI